MKKRGHINIMLNLIGLVKPLAGFMTGAVLMGLAGHLSATFITVLGGYAVLDVLGVSSFWEVKKIFVVILCLALLRGILRYLEQDCNHYIAFKLLAILRDKVFRTLRRLAPAKLEGHNKGDLISLITSDIELLEVFYAHTISPVMIAFLFSLAMVCFIGRYSTFLAFISLMAYVTVGIVIPVILSHAGGEDGLRYREKTGALSSIILDNLRGLGEIIQYGTGNRKLEEMKEMSTSLSKIEGKMKGRAGINAAVTGNAITLFDLWMLLAAGAKCMAGSLSFEGAVISVIALMSSFGPVVALANLGSILESTFAAGERVLDILEEEPVTDEITGKTAVTFGGAELNSVSFSYGTEEILRDVSMRFPRGSIVGINGRSGSGKSTILKLLMRFWEADKGEVSVSGRNVNDINTGNLRDMESYVTQETHLFKDTISGNVKIAKPDATDLEVIEACKKASIHDFIMSLKDGYETEVGELGDTLSGGERQRLGLARAFLHGGDLLLLDEPTSNLDSLNEAIILNALDKMRGEKTIVLVSHRKSTMRIADKVYEMEGVRGRES